MLLNKRKRKPGLKFNPGLALFDFRTTTWILDIQAFARGLICGKWGWVSRPNKENTRMESHS